MEFIWIYIVGWVNLVFRLGVYFSANFYLIFSDCCGIQFRLSVTHTDNENSSISLIIIKWRLIALRDIVMSVLNVNRPSHPQDDVFICWVRFLFGAAGFRVNIFRIWNTVLTCSRYSMGE